MVDKGFGGRQYQKTTLASKFESQKVIPKEINVASDYIRTYTTLFYSYLLPV